MGAKITLKIIQKRGLKGIFVTSQLA